MSSEKRRALIVDDQPLIKSTLTSGFGLWALGFGLWALGLTLSDDYKGCGKRGAFGEAGVDFDGLSPCRQLRRRRRGARNSRDVATKFIFITGSSEKTIIDRMTLGHSSSILIKPASRDKVKRALKMAVKGFGELSQPLSRSYGIAIALASVRVI